MNDNTAAVVLILGCLFFLQRGCETSDHMMAKCLEHPGFEWRNDGCVKIVEKVP